MDVHFFGSEALYGYNARKLGIVSYGLYTPAEFEPFDEVAVRSGLTLEEVSALGIERKCRPAPEDQPIPMAVTAAKQALERAEGTNPEDVDLVNWTGEEYKDYVAQTAAIRLQEEVGCRRYRLHLCRRRDSLGNGGSLGLT